MNNGFQPNCEFDIEIKKSDPKDVEAIIELEKAVFSPKLRYGPSIILALITTSPPHLALTAFLQGTDTTIGFIAGECDQKDGKLGRIITIEIDPEYQHRYIGTQLLQVIENNMKNYYSVSKIELQVHSLNETAINFYIKHGYIKVKELRNYYARGEHALLMMKAL
jgi:ribosomal protein S18 acetylase RimI-like enzyme